MGMGPPAEGTIIIWVSIPITRSSCLAAGMPLMSTLPAAMILLTGRSAGSLQVFTVSVFLAAAFPIGRDFSC